MHIYAAAGHVPAVALTDEFHIACGVLLAASVIVSATLLREDGRGERINLIELQAGQ